MAMKKYFYLVIMAFIAVTSLTLASCSSDDDETTTTDIVGA